MNTAVFSPCERYRYHLFRHVADSGTQLAFVLLNPSTATAEIDDPTIRRCIGFAKRWGFGGLHVVNIFAFRATDPDVMKRQADPVGTGNRRWIKKTASAADLVVCGWGKHGTHLDQGRTVCDWMLAAGAKPKAFVVTRKGQPKHPLYVGYDTPLIPYRRA